MMHRLLRAGAEGQPQERPPLVVNTMGWVKGFGLSLLRDITVAAQPTHLLSLCSGNSRKDVSTSSPWMQEGVPRAHTKLIAATSVAVAAAADALARAHVLECTPPNPHTVL